MITNDIPEKTVNQTLVDYTESLTDWYVECNPAEYRKKRGQYFTPQKVSEFMVKQFEDINKKEKIRILDPGAGIGIFESTFCEYITSLDTNARVSFDLYENDANLVYLLRHNMRICKKEMANKGFKVSYRIFNKDFILSNAKFFNNQNKNLDEKKGYDLVISNPPYYKLKKDSPQVIKMRDIINGLPNIYPLFMALSAKLLKSDGQMTVLTPRSYCSGLYFKNFRNWFFEIVKPLKIHLFDSRKDVFKKYNVLQEIIILTAIKTSSVPENISISVSNGVPSENESKIRNTAYNRIIVEKGDDILMRVPISEQDELIADYIDKFENNLKTLGFKVSTGPVVPFRTKDLILKSTDDCNNFIPLIWMHNIVEGLVKWPVKENKKPIGIRKTKKSEKILVPNKNYVLIKRFSTKERKQRINAGVYLKSILNPEFVGIENHVNYIYKKDGELDIDEVYGIATLLNSERYNRYFQITNGSTQVNSTEIRTIPLPPIETIRKIGSSVKAMGKNDEVENEKIIADEMNIVINRCQSKRYQTAHHISLKRYVQFENLPLKKETINS